MDIAEECHDSLAEIMRQHEVTFEVLGLMSLRGIVCHSLGMDMSSDINATVLHLKVRLVSDLKLKCPLIDRLCRIYEAQSMR